MISIARRWLIVIAMGSMALTMASCQLASPTSQATGTVAQQDHPDADGYTAMNIAAMESPAQLKLLLEQGGDPNARNTRTGFRPLMNAIQAHQDECIDLLLEHGADVNARDDDGDTSLLIAASTNRVDYTLKLLNAGADPRAVNAQGADFQHYLFMTDESVLLDEVKQGREEVRAWLRSHGVPVHES